MSAPRVLTLPEAEALAERVFRAIGYADRAAGAMSPETCADRERLKSDLAGLRRHHHDVYQGWGDNGCAICGHASETESYPCLDAQDRSDGLIRTAREYGVEVPS